MEPQDQREAEVEQVTQAGYRPQMADDSDTIEDEWIVIVKRILEEYKEDPFALTRAMALLRADYLKKRYNKESKVADS
jgi:hypothetical protein